MILIEFVHNDGINWTQTEFFCLSDKFCRRCFSADYKRKRSFQKCLFFGKASKISCDGKFFKLLNPDGVFDNYLYAFIWYSSFIYLFFHVSLKHCNHLLCQNKIARNVYLKSPCFNVAFSDDSDDFQHWRICRLWHHFFLMLISTLTMSYFVSDSFTVHDLPLHNVFSL